MTEESTRDWLSLIVQRRAAVARDITEFTLVRADAGELPPFEPGAHVLVRTPAGSTRKYSLINPPDQRNHYEIAVRRDANGRGGSVSMADGLASGAVIETSLPENAFPLERNASRYLFIAGGIGITPILGMIRHLRQSVQWKDLPIVVVSALGNRDIEARGGLPADIRRFGKPVPFDQLEQLIRQASDRATPPTGEPGTQ